MYLSGVAIPFGIPQQQALSVLPVFGPQDLFGRTSIYHLYPHASSSVMGDTSPLYILFTIDIYHWYHFISSYTNMYIYHLLIFTIYLQFIYHLFTIYLPFIYHLSICSICCWSTPPSSSLKSHVRTYGAASQFDSPRCVNITPVSLWCWWYRWYIELVLCWWLLVIYL